MDMEVVDKLLGIKLFPIGDLWQDREVRFDCSKKELDFRPGETLLELIDEVEDTKGNNGVAGELLITNLRLLWWSKKKRGSNISIGFSCFTSLSTKSSSSRLKGDTESLHILVRHQEHRFEFVFTSLIKTTSQLHSGVARVFAAYDKTRLFRDLKLRGALMTDGELNTLPFEQTYSKVNGVWNLCSDEGNLGSFFVSNVRVVWYSNLSPNFNMSFPYIQVQHVKVRNSKFGPALVLESSQSSGAYILGFKVDPKETLDYVYKEIMSLWKAYKQQPFFGIDSEALAKAGSESMAAQHILSQEEDVEILDAESRGDVIAAYFADANKGMDREPVYCGHLGLAVEQLKEGNTVEQLWSVL